LIGLAYKTLECCGSGTVSGLVLEVALELASLVLLASALTMIPLAADAGSAILAVLVALVFFLGHGMMLLMVTFVPYHPPGARASLNQIGV
jgi:hypothetical protein